MPKFNITLKDGPRDLTLIGTYSETIEVVDHVGWLENGKLREQDIFGPVVKEKDVTIKKALEYHSDLNEDKEITLTHDEQIKFTEQIADILTDSK